jgi:hypothetical protein
MGAGSKQKRALREHQMPHEQTKEGKSEAKRSDRHYEGYTMEMAIEDAIDNALWELDKDTPFDEITAAAAKARADTIKKFEEFEQEKKD